MTNDIKPELIEKASWLADWTQHEYCVIPEDWTPYCICGWRSEESYDVEGFDRHMTEIVLATVADDLRAEGATQALDERLPCDGGCRYSGDGPEETCSRHGRPVAEVWELLDVTQAAAWDEGKTAGLRQSDWEHGDTAEVYVATNPYRIEARDE